MVPVEFRLKRVEKSLARQRWLNLGLLWVLLAMAFQRYLPEDVKNRLGFHPAEPVAAVRPAPVVIPAPAPRTHEAKLDVEHLTARRLSITDAQGRERMTLLVDTNDSPFVIIKDEAGNYRATLAVQMDGRGAVALWNANKEPVYGTIEQKPEAVHLSQHP